MLFSGADFFNGIVQDNVHERIVASQDSSNSSGSIELQGKTFVHISANKRRRISTRLLNKFLVIEKQCGQNFYFLSSGVAAFADMFAITYS